MLRSTVLTTYLFAVFILRLGALRVEGRFSSHYELIGRAAAKAATVLGHVGSGHLHTRQQTYAPGDPAYQADVVSWVCDSGDLSPDLQAQCVIDVNAAINASTIPYCAQRQNELNICLVDPPTPPEDCSDSQVSFDDCANTTIATYDYCFGLGDNTLPDIADCANSQLDLPWSPVSTPESASSTTDSGYGYSSYPVTYTPPSISSSSASILSSSVPAPVTATPTHSGSVTVTGRTQSQTTATIVTTYPTSYVTTTTSLGSTVPVTVNTTVVLTYHSCAGGCTAWSTSIAPPLPSSSVCVRRQRVRTLSS